jgi:hypothetical protein
MHTRPMASQSCLRITMATPLAILLDGDIPTPGQARNNRTIAATTAIVEHDTPAHHTTLAAAVVSTAASTPRLVSPALHHHRHQLPAVSAHLPICS